MATVSRSRRRAIGVAALVALVTVAVAAAVLVWWIAVPRHDTGGDGRASPPSPTPEPAAELTGPLNLLLAGVDTRPGQPTWSPKADAVMIMHVPAAHDRAFLFSLPRDLLVDVPAFQPAGFGGERTKLTHAMSYGSRVPGEDVPDTAQGLQLLARTVSDVTGIEAFDAAAVLNFPGFTDLVDAVGGVDVYLEQRVVSEHLQPDGSPRTLQPGGGGYLGPQKVYEVGEHRLQGWEALDLARQRKLDGGDYTRQRHHRLLVTGLVRQLFAQDMVTDPARTRQVREALGDALVFEGRGGVVDFAFTLQRIRAGQIVLVGLPGTSVIADGDYLGERLDPVSEDFLAAVRDGQVESFLADHAGLIDAGH
jgi:anionic cell wall polymer biosynthesis LytR-Cps2A-Psr (LCP) family protein